LRGPQRPENWTSRHPNPTTYYPQWVWVACVCTEHVCVCVCVRVCVCAQGMAASVQRAPGTWYMVPTPRGYAAKPAQTGISCKNLISHD
jgi:hypothetical protein